MKIVEFREQRIIVRRCGDHYTANVEGHKTRGIGDTQKEAVERAYFLTQGKILANQRRRDEVTSEATEDAARDASAP